MPRDQRPLLAQSGRTAVGEIGQLVESEADTIGDRSGVSLTWSGRKSIGAACLRSKAGLRTSRADAQLVQSRVGDFMTSAAIHAGVLEMVIVEFIRPARVGVWPCRVAKPVKEGNEA